MSRSTRNALAASVATLSLVSLAACGSKDATSAPTSNGAAQVAVTMVAGSNGDDCQYDATTVPAGPVTFTIKNQSATGITEFEVLDGERIIGEKENVITGLPAASLTLTLGGGEYTLYCPAAATEKTALKVTGQAAASPTGSTAQLLQQGADEYGQYVVTQLDGMIVAVKGLQRAVASGDVAAAQKAYAEARPFYEKVESDIEGFVLPGGDPTDPASSLDYLIDMRQSSLDPQLGWSGFHAIERDIFGSKRITATTKKYAADLTANVTTLAGVAKKLTYRPEDLANGAAGLLEEVQSNKISGEEEAFSHTDLADFADNIEGAQQAFEALRPGLTELDPALVATISKRFAAVDRLLKGYEDPAQIGGYELWTPALRKKDASKVSQPVQALADALSGLAEKVATA
ncbi:iron uptake system protein EfeO [Nocardioides ultimimeridianus]